MASIILYDKSTGDKQGWYSSNSTSGSGSTLTMSFATAEMNEFASQANNITINSAKLHVSCSASGADRKKLFRLKLYAGDTLCYDHGSELYSSQYAYDDSDVPITLNAAGVKKWLTASGTKKITSTDPQTKKYFSLSSGYCSYNYVRVTDSWIVIDYTINHSSATLEKTTMDIGSTYGITINAGNTAYTHDIKLVFDSDSYTLNSNGRVAGGSHDIEIPIGIGSDLLSESNFIKGKIEIITYNENGELIEGDPYSYDVTITASEKFAPDPPTDLTVITSSKYSNLYYALSGISKITITPTGAVSKKGASIKKYSVTFNGTTKTCTSGNSVFFSTPTITNTSSTSFSVKTKAIDSRGYSSEIHTRNIYISPYVLPAAEVTFARWDKTNDVQDDIGGTAVKITYTSKYTSKVYTVTGNTALTNSFSLTAYVNGTKYDGEVTSETIISDPPGTETSFSTEKNYTLQFIAADKFGDATSKDKSPKYTLNSAMYLLHFRHKTNSVGIGCAGEKLESGEKGRVSIAWPTHFKDAITLTKPLKIVHGGTESTSRDGAWKNIVADGGEITGNLLISGALTTSGILTVTKKPLKIQLTGTGSNFLNFHNDSGKIAALNVLPFTDNGTLVNRYQFLQFAGLADGTTTTHAEFYVLPNVTVYDSADKVPTDTEVYSILTTKNHYYSHTLSGKANVFEFGTLLIQTGEVDFGEVSSDTKDVTVTFKKAFATTPAIIIGFNWGSDEAGAGKWSISARAESATGFTARVNNGEGNKRSPDGYWVAIGKRA